MAFPYRSFPPPVPLPPDRTADPGPAVLLPTPAQQAKRLRRAWAQLAEREEELAERGELERQLVLVLDTAGPAEALRQLAAAGPNLEWLGEWPSSLPASEVFALRDDPEAEVLPGVRYQLALGRRGLYALRKRWERWLHDRLERGEARWAEVFERLFALTTWSKEDRSGGPRLEAAIQDARHRHQADLFLELELWYRQSRVHRGLAEQAIRQRLQALPARVLDAAEEPAIRYHALLISLHLPALEAARPAFKALLNTPLVKALRPQGSFRVRTPLEAPPEPPPDLPPPQSSSGAPRVALVDGLPLQSHPLLAGRLQVMQNGPGSDSYALQERRHATHLASLILHGDLNAGEEPLPEPLLVYPLLQPDPADWTATHQVEALPADRLPVRLVREAVEAVVEAGQASRQPIRVIVLALNDTSGAFQGELSPVARLLDELALRHGLLILLSTGNVDEPLELPMEPGQLYALQRSPEGLKQATLRQLFDDSARYRLQGPGEALNALTIGSLNADAAPMDTAGYRYDLLQEAPLASPLSRQGPGYRTAVKPDLLLPGGRQLFTDQFFLEANRLLLAPAPASRGKIRPPGLLAAAPTPDGRDSTLTYVHGSDKATALAARHAARVAAGLPAGDRSPQEEALLLKALMIHRAQREKETKAVTQALSRSGVDEPPVDWLPAYLGHGKATEKPPAGSLSWLATGHLPAEGALAYALPLPAALLEQQLPVFLRLTLTWFSAMEGRGGPYRLSRCWAELPPKNPLGLRAVQPNRQPLRRSTVWHEEYRSRAGARSPREQEGPKDGTTPSAELRLKVNARPVHRQLIPAGEVPFALVVSLWTDPPAPLEEWFAQDEGFPLEEAYS